MRFERSSPRRARAEGHDPLGLSRWLYTDLLLGLALVFLATSTAAVDSAKPPITEPDQPPSTSPSESASLTESPSESRRNCITLTRRAIKINVRSDWSDRMLRRLTRTVLRRELGKRGLDRRRTKFGIMLAFGVGPSSQIGLAKQRAGIMNDRLKQLMPARFDGAAVRNFWTSGPSGPQLEYELFPLVDRCAR